MLPRNRTLPVFPLLMITVGVLLILGAVLWTVNLSAATVVAYSAAPTAQAALIPYPAIARISAEDAKAAFDNGNAVFIDTRGDPYFSQEHIPDALSITGDELPARMGELDPSKWVITYCT